MQKYPFRGFKCAKGYSNFTGNIISLEALNRLKHNHSEKRLDFTLGRRVL